MAFYGKYRAEVVDIADPEQRGRIRVKCPDVLGEHLSRWALPCFPPNTFTVPDKGTLVWIEFEGGKKDSPVWTGVFYTKDQHKSKFGATYNPASYITSSLGESRVISAKSGIFIKAIGAVVDINTEADTGITKLGNIQTYGITASGNIKTSKDIHADGNITDADGYVHSH